MVLKALAACLALACVWCAAAQGVDDATAAPPTIRFEYAFYAVPADFPYLWVSAYRVGNLKGRATAAWTTADSSASNGVDYRQSTGELSWADGVGGAQQLYVPLIPRRTGPYDRTFTVLLHDQTGAALSFPSAAVVTITQPSVWQLWADASTAGAGADPFGVPNGSIGSAVTNTPSPSDGAGAGTVNPTSATNPSASGGTTATTPSAGANPNGATPTTPAAGGSAPTGPISGGSGTSSSGTATDPSTNAGAGSGSGSTIPSGSASGAGSGAGSAGGSGADPGTGSGAPPTGGSDSGTPTTAGGTVTGSGSGTPTPGSGGTASPQSGGTGSGSQPTGSQQTGSQPTGGSGSGQQSGTGSTTTPGSSGSGSVQPAGGSGTPTTPTQPLSTTTGASQQQSGGGSQQSGGGSQQSGGGGGGNAASASTGILTQFASAFTWDSAAYQTDNSNNFVVVGVSRLQVLPLGLQPCSVRYSTVDGTGRAGVDYTATSGVLEYGANDFAPRAIFVPIRQGDATSAPTGVKVFAIRLSDPVNAFLGVPSSAPISVSAVPFSEGKVVLTSDAYATPVQAGRAVATVQRLIGSQGAVNVTYGTTDGTAKAGTDYTATSGTLSWADGDTAPRNISIPLLASAAAAALPGDGTVAGAPNFFLSLALAADSKGFLGGPRTAAMFITNLAPRSGTGSGTATGNGSGTGAGTTQTNVSGSTGMGVGTGGSGTGVKPTASSTGANKPPTASSTGTRAPPVVVPPPATTGTASTSTGTATNTTTERSGAPAVRGVAPAALATVLLSALWLSA